MVRNLMLEQNVRYLRNKGRRSPVRSPSRSPARKMKSPKKMKSRKLKLVMDPITRTIYEKRSSSSSRRKKSSSSRRRRNRFGRRK